MDVETGLLARLGQGFDEILPVHIGLEDVPRAVGPAHDVVNGPGIPRLSICEA